MARHKSLTRTVRSLLTAMAAVGLRGDIEVNCETNVLRLHVTGESGTSLPVLTEETSDDVRKLL